MSNIVSLESFLEDLKEIGEDGTSKYQLRNENVQTKNRVARIPKLKKELKKKSKLIIPAELALPFNPLTGKEDEKYNPDKKFRPNMVPSDAALMLKRYANDHDELKKKLMQRAGFDEWDTSNVEVLTDDDKKIFNRYRVPSIYTFQVVHVDIPVMTKDYGRDYVINVDRDPITGEVVGDEPLALQANRFFRDMCYEEVNDIQTQMNDGKITLTDKQFKEKRQQIFSKVAVSDDHPINYLMVVELPLSNDYSIAKDCDIANITEETIKDHLVMTKLTAGIREAYNKYKDGSWKKYDSYYDFWEIDMACPTSTDNNTPAEIGQNTTYEKPSYVLSDEPSAAKFVKALADYTANRENIEQVVVNSVRIPKYDDSVERQLCAALSTAIDPTSEYLTKDVITRHKDFITVAMGDEADALLLDAELDSPDRAKGALDPEAAKAMAKEVNLTSILSDEDDTEISVDEIDIDSDIVD